MTASRRRERVRLPRYLRAKRLRGGVQAYFWELPSWARPPAERQGRRCPVHSEALGTDLASAIGKSELLNAHLDEWRIGVEVAAPEGTVNWLFAWYRKRDRFKELSAEVRKDYRRAMDNLAGVQLKTATFGQMRIAAVKSEHADRLYKHLLGVHGKRQAAYSMQVARRAWYEWGRDRAMPNPFARMNIKMKAEKGNRATSRAEYDAFRTKARELGYQSMAAAAAVAFELIRRVSDVFGYIPSDPTEEPGGIYWEDYRPGEEIVLVQHKTGIRQTIPLRGDEGEMLFPELEEELARTTRGQPDREVDGRQVTPIVLSEATSKRYTERTARQTFVRIRDAAGLPKDMTLTGFRHGGATEAGDAAIAAGSRDPDLRPLTGHATRSMTDIYDKVTVEKARTLATTRRRFVDTKKAAEA